jgi:aminoglycoside phosphotransferase (APT) family kinase protein
MAEDLPGLPAAPVEKWLRSVLPDEFANGPWHAEVISGGLSNITYRLHLPSGRVVILRRPPRGDTLPRAHDMAREYRVLSALVPTAVPVPVPIALCTDPAVLGKTFYLMREVQGTVLRTTDDTEPLPEAARGQLASAAITTLADLHAIDVDAVGLGDYGKRSGYCARQIRTWGGQWERSKTRDLPDMERLLGLLSERAPEDSGLAIVHGDFRIDNTITAFAADGTPRIAAVLDWELSTLGDPLADLGTTLSYWHDPGDVERAQIPVSGGLTDKPGFPTGRELAQMYASRTGRDLGNLPFYMALGEMKLAVICEGVHARYLGGQTVGEGYDRVGPAVPLLVSRALKALREGPNTRM